MNIKVQKANLQDLSGIVAIWAEFMALLQRTNPDYWQVKNGPAAFSNFLLRSLDDPDVLVAVVELEGQGLVGFALARIEILPEWFGAARLGLIRYLAVSENYRNQGIGHALVAFVLDWFQSLGISRIELYVLKGLPASRFWSMMGFKDFMDRRFLEI